MGAEIPRISGLGNHHLGSICHEPAPRLVAGDAGAHQSD